MFTFHYYGLMIALGILVGLVVAWWRKKLYGISENDLENLFILTVPLGVIGARIYHVLDKWSYYSQNLNQIVAVWNGGLGIFGGVLGGLVGLGIFIKIQNFKSSSTKKLPANCYLLSVLDFLMPSLAIGQAIGRWGNFFNQEVFGPPTNLPWGWFIPANLRPEMWKNYNFFQPTFAYESLWAFLGFIAILLIENGNLVRVRNFLYSAILSRNKTETVHNLETRSQKRIAKNFYLSPSCPTGILVAFYCVWYGMGRFFLEFLRFDTAEIWGIKTAQIISLLLIDLGIYLIMGRKKVL